MSVKNEESSHFRLSEEEKKSWLEHGYVKISNCFTRDAAEDFISTVWVRLGASPADQSTWPTGRVNMPGHMTVPAKDFAPKAFAAICELVGGEDKIEDWCKNWKDGFIVNLGGPKDGLDESLDFRTLDNWHADGDWFFHFLDSPEQALLVIPLFTDIKPGGGGTVICTDGIRVVAKRLYDHPEGMTPFLGVRNSQNPQSRIYWNQWVQDPTLTRDESIHEVTGEVGDVFILHPFMLHSSSRNLLRLPRVITNPLVMLKEPFNYNRADPSGYSLVEQKTLRELGRPDGLPEWKTTGPRGRVVPLRVSKQKEMKDEEIKRLKCAGISPNKIAVTPLVDEDYPS